MSAFALILRPAQPFPIDGHADFRGVSFAANGAYFFLAAATDKEPFALSRTTIIHHEGRSYLIREMRRRPEPLTHNGQTEHVHGYLCDEVSTAVLRNGPAEVEGCRVITRGKPLATIVLPFVLTDNGFKEVLAMFEYGNRSEGLDLVYFFERFETK